MFGRTYSDLGSVVGQINVEDIRANQLERRGYDWENGYVTPSDGQDTNRDGQPVRKLTKDAKSRSEEHTSELQSRFDLVCRLLLEKKKKTRRKTHTKSKHTKE